MSSKEYTYLPKALSHDFDWVHMHWVGQWLYMTIQASQQTVVPGVYKWNVDHVMAQAQALTRDEVLAAAEELAAAGYLMVDERSGECYLRKFLYYDNLIKKPNILVNLATSIRFVGSWDIRAAMVSDLRILRGTYSDLSGWTRVQVNELLAASYETPDSAWIDERARGVLPYVRLADGVADEVHVE